MAQRTVIAIIGLMIGVLFGFSCNDNKLPHYKAEKLIGIDSDYTPYEEGELAFSLNKRGLSYNEVVEIMGRAPNTEDWTGPNDCTLIYHNVCIRGICKYVEIELDEDGLEYVTFRVYTKPQKCCLDSLNVKKVLK